MFCMLRAIVRFAAVVSLALGCMARMPKAPLPTRPWTRRPGGDGLV